MKKIKILIADDHSVVRIGLATLLEYEADMSVVGDTDDGAGAVALAKKLSPDVVIMDLKMPGMDGIEATRQIREAAPQTRVLILTSYGDSEDIGNAVAAGANGVIVKHTANDKLIEAIRTVYGGGSAFSPEVSLPTSCTEPPAFTERQMDVLAAAARGLQNQDIAKMLGVSKDMVKAHMKVIFQKLGAANRAEAVAIALRKHLLKT